MDRIKELRTREKLSQQALADMLHVTQQSIYKYEHNLAIPELDILKHMSDIFDTSIDYIVEETDIPLRYEVIDVKASLTRDEMRIIEYYRRLSPKSKDFLQEIISMDKNNPEQE